MEILEKVEQLKAELDSLRPLDAEAEARIMQKFRLDWNYHSNNLEGNSLTYGETKALILFGITAQGKPLKDHFEITGHNDAINWVLDLVKGESELTEVFIRELHTLLLKESSYKKAKTLDGKPTRRKIEVGKYKTQPNHVITATGETFYFATPEETPAKMQELVEWFRDEKQKPDVNPILLSALLHYKFIRIHPFDDGNGRVSRILMNFILMQFKYPPVIIKTEDKENYYAVLQLADADQMQPFIDYIGTNLERSLEIMIKGARGEDIEEQNDLDKELALLERTLISKEKDENLIKSPTIMRVLADELVIPLIRQFLAHCSKFDRFYLKNNVIVLAFQLNRVFLSGTREKVLAQLNNFAEEVVPLSKFEVDYENREFKNPDFGSFDFTSRLDFEFKELTYSIRITGNRFGSNSDFEKPYSKMMLSEDLYKALNRLVKSHRDFIKEQTKSDI